MRGTHRDFFPVWPDWPVGPFGSYPQAGYLQCRQGRLVGAKRSMGPASCAIRGDLMGPSGASHLGMCPYCGGKVRR